MACGLFPLVRSLMVASLSGRGAHTFHLNCWLQAVPNRSRDRTARPRLASLAYPNRILSLCALPMTQLDVRCLLTVGCLGCLGGCTVSSALHSQAVTMVGWPDGSHFLGPRAAAFCSYGFLEHTHMWEPGAHVPQHGHHPDVCLWQPLTSGPRAARHSFWLL